MATPTQPRNPMDLMIRLQGSFSSSANPVASLPRIHVFETNEFTGRVNERIFRAQHDAHRACLTLGSVIDSLVDKCNYQTLYLNYSIGTVSDDEFAEQSEHYAQVLRDTNPEQLAASIGVLLTYSTKNFTTSDIGELFSATERVADAAIELACKHCIPKDQGTDNTWMSQGL